MIQPSPQDFQVARLYQPRLQVPSLEKASEFFQKVFGRESAPLSSVMKQAPAPGHSTDHSVFTVIGDVILDSLDPRLYTTQGERRYPDISEAHLDNPGGWLVDDALSLYGEVEASGIRVTDARGNPLDKGSWSGGPSPFYLDPRDAGMRYALFETFRFPLDPRGDKGWIPSVSSADPLGLVKASHHTIRTSAPDRATRIFRLLGGEIVEIYRDDLREMSGPLVALAGSLFHLATPDAAEPQELDTYEAITWHVENLERAAQHLESSGVSIAIRSEGAFVTDPRTSLGVPWGFTDVPPTHEERT